MDRRRALTSALIGSILVATARAADAPMDHSMHHHGAGPYAEAGQAAGRCVEAGQACLAHCLVLLGNGDASLAACSKSVNQMLALCTALQSLANQQSPMTPGLAKVCFDACSSCEKECRKHEDEHAECRACAESCAGCAKACKDIMA